MTEPVNTPPDELIPEEDEGNLNIVQEFFYFIRENKKWWLIPLALMVVLLGLLLFLGHSSPAFAWLYTLL